MKRCLLAILVAILAIGIIFGASCSNSQQRITELERQVESLTQQIRPSEAASVSWVLEDDMPVETVVGWKNPYRLPFDLKVGDRVEGEVTVDGQESIVIGQVKDPYENIVVQTDWVHPVGGKFNYIENRGFPWRFAFVAYTEGQYEIRMFTYWGSAGQAHLKITCYENE